MQHEIQGILAKEVVKFMKEKKLNQHEFGKIYGCNQNYVSFMLNGKRPFNINKLKKIIGQYDCILITNIGIEENESIKFTKVAISIVL